MSADITIHQAAEKAHQVELINLLIESYPHRLQASEITALSSLMAKLTDPNRIKELAENYALIDQNNTSKKEGNKIDVKSVKSADSITEALKRQQEAVTRLQKGYKDNSLEMAKYDAVAALGSQASAPQIERAEKLAADKFVIEQRLADKRAAIEADALAKAQEQRNNDLTLLERQLDAGSVTFEQAQKRRAAIAGEYSRKIAEEGAKGSVNYIEENRAQVDPVQSLKNQNAQKLALMEAYQKQEQAILNESYGAGNLSYSNFIVTKQSIDAQYLALRTAQETQFQEQQTAAQWQLLSQQGLGYEMLTSAVDSFSGNASNVLTGLITQTMSLSDAARSLGNTMLNSVVNAIVQMGVEAAKNFILTQTLGVASQAANATAAMTGGAMALAAWTPAAIAASIATGGAASLTGVASFQAAIASGQMANTLSGLGSQAVKLAGARYNGGNVRGGSAYKVGERDLPELMQIGNELIAIPGNNGRVFSYDDVTGAPMIPKAPTGKQYMAQDDNGKDISNKDVQGGSKNISVNIVFNDHSSGAHNFDAQATQNGDAITVQAFLSDMREKGPMHRSITQSTSATTRL